MSDKIICNKCGKDNIVSAKFCRGCGSSLGGEQKKKQISKENRASKTTSKGSGFLTVAILISLIIIIALVCFIVYFKFEDVKGLLTGNKESVVSTIEEDDEYDDEDEDEDNEDEDENAAENKRDETSESTGESDIIEEEVDRESGKSDHNKAESELEEEQKVYQVTADDRKFNISPDTKSNYENAVYPSNYEHYSSGTKDFGFSYSTELYNDVVFDDTERKHDYGNLIQSVDFSGTDGSKLVFRLFKRTDNLSVEKATEFVHSTETTALEQPEDILFTKKDKEGHGKVIVTGKDGNNVIYDMSKVRSKYIMQMLVSYPEATDEDDRNRKWYVTECYYRMCDFSDSKNKFRSFEDYLKEQ